MSKIFDALQKASGDEPEKRPEGEHADLRDALPVETPSLPGKPIPEDPAPSPGAARVVPTGDGNLHREGSGEDTLARELANLRAGIDRRLPANAPRTLLFAGSVPGEGSSTVAARFARFLAEDPELSVALLDVDLRNRDPRTVDLTEEGRGVASLLAGRLSLAKAFRPTALSRLQVIPSEGASPDAYRLLTGDRIPGLLDGLRRSHPVCILDAAPILAAPETPVLAGRVDGTILVVRANRTKREVVQKALAQLRQYGAPILGVVMNRQQFAIPEFIYRRL
jgi:protein-tyrosine kinase